MHIVILGNVDGWYAKDLDRAARERGHRTTILPFRGLTACVRTGRASVYDRAEGLSDADAVIVRTMPPGSLEQVVFRMDLLSVLEARGAQIVNPPRSVECAVDKYLTTAKLSAAGLPVPATIVCEHSEAAMEAFEELGGDVVVKPIFGSEGRGIVRVSDPDMAVRVFRTLERIQATLYLQQFIDHEGFDIRVMVLDGQILGGMRRRNPNDFRTNVSRNATAEAFELTDEHRDLALRAASAIGTRIAGIDLLHDRSGRCYVIEVNGVPGWRALNQACQLDVATRLIESIEHKRVV